MDEKKLRELFKDIKGHKEMGPEAKDLNYNMFKDLVSSDMEFRRILHDDLKKYEFADPSRKFEDWNVGFEEKYLGKKPAPVQPAQQPPAVPLAPPTQVPLEQIAAQQATGVGVEMEVPEPQAPQPEPTFLQKAVSYGKDLMTSVKRGVAQGKAIQTNKLTDVASGNTGAIDFEAMAKANKEVRDIGQTATEQDFAKSDGLWDDITDYAKMAIPVISESIATLVRSGSEEVGVGAAIGAGAGSVVPVIGTAAGAATGAMAGTAMAGYNMELYATIMDELESKGVDVSDPTQLKAAFSDKELMSPILQKANTRAVIIGTVDLVGGAAGNAAAQAIKAARPLTKTGRAFQKLSKAATKVDDMATAASGEASAQLATEGKITPQDVILETLGEAPIAGTIRTLGQVQPTSSFFKKKSPAPVEPERQPEAEAPQVSPNQTNRDSVVESIQQRGIINIDEQNPLNFVPEIVVRTTDRIDNDDTVDPVQVNEAMDWFYDARKQMLAMKEDPNRMLTTAQIDGILEDIDGALHYIGEAKANLENTDGRTVRSETEQIPSDEVAVDDTEWEAFQRGGTIDPMRIEGIKQDIAEGFDITTAEPRYQAIAEVVLGQEQPAAETILPAQVGEGQSDALRDVESTAKALEDSPNTGGKYLDYSVYDNILNSLTSESDRAENKKNAIELAKKEVAQIRRGIYGRESGRSYDEQLKSASDLVADLTEASLNDKRFRNFFTSDKISEAYHTAKADGSNPELVAAVESLLSNETPSQTPAEMGNQTATEAAVVSGGEVVQQGNEPVVNESGGSEVEVEGVVEEVKPSNESNSTHPLFRDVDYPNSTEVENKFLEIAKTDKKAKEAIDVGVSNGLSEIDAAYEYLSKYISQIRGRQNRFEQIKYEAVRQIVEGRKQSKPTPPTQQQTEGKGKPNTSTQSTRPENESKKEEKIDTSKKKPKPKSPKQLSSDPKDWVSEWMKGKRKISVASAVKETGMTAKEATQLNVGKLAREGGIGVERAAEEIITMAREQSDIELDAQQVRDAIIETLKGDRAKSQTEQKQEKPTAESTFPVINREGTPPVLLPLPNMSEAEMEQLSKFLHERMPEMIKDGGKIALANLQQEADKRDAIREMMPDIAAKLEKISLAEWAAVNSVNPTISSETLQYARQMPYRTFEKKYPNISVEEYNRIRSIRPPSVNDYLPLNQMNDIVQVVGQGIKFAKDWVLYYGKGAIQKGIKALYDFLNGKVKNAKAIAQGSFAAAAQPKKTRDSNIQDPDLKRHAERGGNVIPQDYTNEKFKKSLRQTLLNFKRSFHRRYPLLNAVTFARAIEFMQGSRSKVDSIAINQAKGLMEGYMSKLKTEEQKRLFHDYVLLGDMAWMAENKLFKNDDDYDFYTTYDGVPISKSTVIKEFENIKQLAEQDPDVKAAIKERLKVFDTVVEDAVKRGLMLEVKRGDSTKDIAKDYHAAKADRSNPVLVKSVEFLMVKYAKSDALSDVKNTTKALNKIEADDPQAIEALYEKLKDPKNPNYFHHMTLNYKTKKMFGSGNKQGNAFSVKYAGPTIARKKTDSSYSPNVIFSDFISLKEMLAQIEAHDNISLKLKNIYSPEVVKTVKESQDRYADDLKAMIAAGAPKAEIDNMVKHKKELIDAIFDEMMAEKGYVEVSVPGSAKFTVEQQLKLSGADQAIQDFINTVQAFGQQLTGTEKAEIAKQAKALITSYKAGETMWIPEPLAQTLIDEKNRADSTDIKRVLRNMTNFVKKMKLISWFNAVRFFITNLASNGAGYVMDKNFAKLESSSFKKGVNKAFDITMNGRFTPEVEELIRLRVIGSQADLSDAHLKLNKLYQNTDWRQRNIKQKMHDIFFIGGDAVAILDNVFKIASYYETLAELNSGTKLYKLSTGSNLAALEVLQKTEGNKYVAAKIARERYGDSEQAAMAAQKASEFALPFIRFSYLSVNDFVNRGANIKRSMDTESAIDKKLIAGLTNGGQMAARILVFHGMLFAAQEGWNQLMFELYYDDDDEKKEELERLWKLQKRIGSVIVGFDNNDNPMTIGLDTMLITALRNLGLMNVLEEMGLKQNTDFKPDIENPLLLSIAKPSGSSSTKLRPETQTGAVAAKILNDMMMNLFTMLNPLLQVASETFSGRRMDYNKMAFVPDYKNAYGGTTYNIARMGGFATLAKLRDSEIAEEILDFFSVNYMPSYKKQSPVEDLMFSTMGMQRMDIKKNILFTAKQIISDKFVDSPSEFRSSSKESGADNQFGLMKEARSRIFKALIDEAEPEKVNQLIEKYKEYGGDRIQMRNYLENKDIFTGVKDVDKSAILDFLNGNEDAFVTTKSGSEVLVKDLIDKTQAKIILAARNLEESTGMTSEERRELIKSIDK